MRQSQDFRLIRFLAAHALVGAGIAAVTVTLLMLGDVGGLGGLVARSDVGVLALAVMTAFFVVTFASVQMSVALMLHRSSGNGGRTRDGWAGMLVPPQRELQPVRVRAGRR
ncbi:hypothetical protein [Acuticoccus sp. I52.16.1]|uniref:hypothetical protein n=1 Tax=Acuticoccus sp. I52.16.1 TaxID=2928472 RepID=UPI001FD25448|nr:hypothetical protein [Acuticoccus sp. I52.16.1]UOM36130.1 hypothetical protein MRB58_08030 [Acuticoccus sp. I52.16.1]